MSAAAVLVYVVRVSWWRLLNRPPSDKPSLAHLGLKPKCIYVLSLKREIYSLLRLTSTQKELLGL